MIMASSMCENLFNIYQDTQLQRESFLGFGSEDKWGGKWENVS